MTVIHITVIIIEKQQGRVRTRYTVFIPMRCSEIFISSAGYPQGCSGAGTAFPHLGVVSVPTLFS